MLEIKDLYVSIDNKEILKGVNLSIYPGEVHALMGINGSGKSTLSYTLIGRACCKINSGDIIFYGKSIKGLSTDERARLGILLSFQHPVEIPGISSINFLQTALHAYRTDSHASLNQDLLADIRYIRQEADRLNIPIDLLKRSVNENFSGGEKKRLEILQMAVLKPKLGILDELDSGLDIDALKTVSSGINKIRSSENSFLLITHYQRILDYVTPDFVHVFVDGRIVSTGTKELAVRLEKEGYGFFT